MLNDGSEEEESGPLSREPTWQQRPSSEEHPAFWEKEVPDENVGDETADRTQEHSVCD
jgi:hypothetical protein